MVDQSEELGQYILYGVNPAYLFLSMTPDSRHDYEQCRAHYKRLSNNSMYPGDKAMIEGIL